MLKLLNARIYLRKVTCLGDLMTSLEGYKGLILCIDTSYLVCPEHDSGLACNIG
jgi:hypothetical protein